MLRPARLLSSLNSQQWLRRALWALFACVAAVQVAAIFLRPPSDRLADLHVYYGAISDLRQHGTLYDFAAANGDPFTYPPFAGLILWPLTLMPELVAGAIWTAATISTIAVMAWIIVRRIEHQLGQWQNATASAALALVIIVSASATSNIRFGQVSWFLVALVLLDAVGVVPKRFRGIGIGIAAAVKLTPLIFIAWLWFSGQRRAATTALATFAACTVASAVLLPSDFAQFWRSTIFQTDRIGNLAAGGNQSLNGMLLRLTDGGGSYTKVLWGLLCIAIAAAALTRAVRATRAGHHLVAVAIVGCAGIAVSPVSWTHHQFWILAALAGTLTAPWTSGMRAFILAVMLLPAGATVSALIPLLAPIGDNLRSLTAIAIAAAIPFRETRPDRSLRALRAPKRWNGKSRTKRKAVTVVAMIAASFALASCSSSDELPISRPSGQHLITVIATGTVDGVKWRAELVREDNVTCTQVVAAQRIMSKGCEFQNDERLPVNFEVVGNNHLTFIHGAVHQSVATLKTLRDTSSAAQDVQLASADSLDSLRYFGFATTPQDALHLGLVGFSHGGQQVYSDDSKIRSTVAELVEAPRN